MEAIASIEDPTLRFFLEGEAMEKAARRAEADRVARERERGFAGHFGNDNGDTLRVRDATDQYVSVERRGHGGAIAFAALSSLTAIGVAAWMWMTPPVRPALWWLKGPAPTAALTEGQTEAKTEMKTEAPTAGKLETTPPQEITAAKVETPAPVAAPAMGADVPQAPAEPASSAAKTAAAAPGAPIIEQLPPAAPIAAAPSAVAREASGERRRERGEALRGYVWSPTAKAMVPSEASATTEAASPPEAVLPTSPNSEKKEVGAPAAAPSSSDSVMAPASLTGPGIAPPSTGPAPDETARVPTTEPAPFESGQPAPAKGSAPIID